MKPEQKAIDRIRAWALATPHGYASHEVLDILEEFELKHSVRWKEPKDPRILRTHDFELMIGNVKVTQRFDLLEGERDEK